MKFTLEEYNKLIDMLTYGKIRWKERMATYPPALRLYKLEAEQEELMNRVIAKAHMLKPK